MDRQRWWNSEGFRESLKYTATIVSAVVALLVAFPHQVESFFGELGDRLTRRSVVRELKKAAVTDEISEFDINNDARSGVVELLSDGGAKVIWLNPGGKLYWARLNTKVGEVIYPADTVIPSLVSAQCVEQPAVRIPQYNVACAMLGNTHAIISTPLGKVDRAEFRENLARLAGRVDQHFLR